MTSAVTLSTHLYWITSRAAGTAALILSSLAVATGLVIGGRLVRGRGRICGFSTRRSGSPRSERSSSTRRACSATATCTRRSST